MEGTLLQRLGVLPLGAGQIGLCWLGQASYALRTPEGTVLIDPFLSPHPDRLFPPPFLAEDAHGVDLVLCTHDHIDHLDRDALPAVAAASPDARFVVPTPIVDVVTGLGIDESRTLGMQPGSAPRSRGSPSPPSRRCTGSPWPMPTASGWRHPAGSIGSLASSSGPTA
jgi:hypothetical protein